MTSRWVRRLSPVGLCGVLAWACSSSPGTGSGGGGASSSHGPTTSTSSGTAGSGGGLPLTPTFMVSGVVTDGTNPVAGAIVMQGGGQPATTTGADGTFTITLTQAIPGTPTVIAAKVGYRSAGQDFQSLPTGPIELALRSAAPPDNTEYAWGDPGLGNTLHDDTSRYCGHCHTTFAKQFQSSTHAASARDPLVQDLYAGVAAAFTTAQACQAAGGTWRTGIVPGAPTTTASKCYLGSGVLPDLNPGCGAAGQLACDDPALPAKPSAFGHCADCHAPGVGGAEGGRNLHDAEGVGFQDGDHCDFCHHVRDVDLSKPPGVGGALILQRPNEVVSGTTLYQITYGPLPDVVNGFVGGSYQPKFSASGYCGGCHEQNQEALVPGSSLDASRWPAGLPTHSTYSEWAESSYNTPGTQCQACHMAPDDTGLTNAVDVTTPSDASIIWGFARTPDQIRQHGFPSALQGSPRLIDGALGLTLTMSTTGTDLTVVAHVANIAAGHAIPSGEPMRALLLVVDAEACGSPMATSGGMSINDVGGATATGTVGTDVTLAGTTMTWASGATVARPGDVVRVVHPTGTFDDYAGIGFFADASLTPAQKGLEVRTPVGQRTVLSASGGTLTLDAAIAAQSGDLVYLGDALAGPVMEGDASRALAGLPGYTFARVLVDASGARDVPHHRAVDIASDNRIPPLASAATTHAFSIPAGCATATVTATLVYRRTPVMLARQRGWAANDYIVGTATANVALP